MQVITSDTRALSVGSFVIVFDGRAGCQIAPQWPTDPPARFRITGAAAANALDFIKHYITLFRVLRDAPVCTIPKELEPYRVQESEGQP